MTSRRRGTAKRATVITRGVPRHDRLVPAFMPQPMARYKQLHRRHGWALRWYRGEHRGGAWTVDALAEAVAGQLAADRATHRRSLRRRSDGGPVYLGTRLTNLRFYGALGKGDADGTLTLMPAEDDVVCATIPALEQVQHERAHQPAADEAPTGPILLEEI